MFMATVGPKHFIWLVCYQLLALTYMAQGRLAEAEAVMEPHARGLLNEVMETRSSLKFAGFELAELYSRALRLYYKLCLTSTTPSNPPERC